VAIDPRGSVYVADTANARVVRLWGEGAYLSELGGPADVGGAGLSGAGSAAVSASSGDLYVADTGHNRVLVYSPAGALLTRVGAGGGDGTAGSSPGSFNHPGAVAVAPSGYVFVADTANDRIVKLRPDGSLVGQFGVIGSGEGRLHRPSGVAADGAGRVYVADNLNNRIEVFDEAGHYLARWGLRGVGPGQLSQPTGLAVGCEGSVFVADTNNNRIQRFDPAAPAGVGCVPASAWPPPLDVAPVLRVNLLRRTGILARRALALTVSCERGCQVRVTATLSPSSPRSPRRRVALLASSRPLGAALTGHVRLRVGPGALRHLRRALGRRRAMLARVRILAIGPTGRRTVVTRTYAVAR
jgi:sugar lactone lactonase YvrE